MWVFLSSRLRTFLFFAVLLPLAGWLVRRVARFVERRSGRSTGLTRTLDRAADVARR